jgi:hypothetical protein
MKQNEKQKYQTVGGLRGVYNNKELWQRHLLWNLPANKL